VAEAGKIDGRFNRSGSATIAGLPVVSLVLDTTGAPMWLRGGTPGAGVFRFRAEAEHHYLAVDAAATLSPEVRSVQNGLRSTALRADWLLLAPREFLPAAQALVALRREQGLVAKTVALEDVYQQFGFGETGPEAIRTFLEYAWQSWKRPSPKYVVLLGDSTYDPKDYLGTHVADRLPFYPLKTSFLWTASDPAYAAVNGDDLVPDLAIGRLPAGSVAQAETLVAKVVAFERAGQALDGKAVLVADNADTAGQFEADADELAATALPGREVQKLYLRDLGAGGMRTEIKGAFDSGASLLSYIGHLPHGSLKLTLRDGDDNPHCHAGKSNHEQDDESGNDTGPGPDGCHQLHITSAAPCIHKQEEIGQGEDDRGSQVRGWRAAFPL
jgi:hypothetical protein